ncbi:YihY/virulence factor BrkB family protein [Sphingomonas montana]|uniref:YihY/virulence factor BrkB family protein n=1 Tax=Sphingomonas montana TaxID=1843236 RepID=UPI0009F9FBC0|nr:YihY/virulence factor BrkB family protein [Sphingomonas montana]
MGECPAGVKPRSSLPTRIFPLRALSGYVRRLHAIWVGVRDTPSRGQDSRWPWEIPFAGWLDVLVRTRRKTFEEHLTLLASGIAYQAFLTLVPAVVAIALIYGMIAEPARVARDMAALIDIVPGGGQALLTERLISGMGSRRRDLIGIASTVLLTLYTAALFARSVMAAMNIVYHQSRRPRFLKRWAVAAAIAISGGLFMLMALCGIALLGYVQTLLPNGTPLLWSAVRIGFWTAMAAAAGAGFMLIYRYAPARADARWAWCVPGALAATLLWLAATYGFGVYVANFARYDATYGSLAAVVVLQVWMFLSAVSLLLGARLNVELELQTMLDTTTGTPMPIGQRGATAADRVEAGTLSSQQNDT